jgi:hypothetical protein
VIVGFGSLFDRFNSLFGRPGNRRTMWRPINDLGGAIRSFEGVKPDFRQFLPVHQGNAGQPARKYCTASSRRKR